MKKFKVKPIITDDNNFLCGEECSWLLAFNESSSKFRCALFSRNLNEDPHHKIKESFSKNFPAPAWRCSDCVLYTESQEEK